MSTDPNELARYVAELQSLAERSRELAAVSKAAADEMDQLTARSRELLSHIAAIQGQASDRTA